MSASREINLARRAVKAARTHLRHANSLNPATDDVRCLVAIHLRELAAVETDICRTLASAIDDDNAKPWKARAA